MRFIFFSFGVWVSGVGFGVSCFMLRVQRFGVRVPGGGDYPIAFRVAGPPHRKQSSGFRCHGSRFMVQGKWCMVHGAWLMVHVSWFGVWG